MTKRKIKKIIFKGFKNSYNLIESEKTFTSKLLKINFISKEVVISDSYLKSLKFNLTNFPELTREEIANNFKAKILKHKNKISKEILYFYTLFWFNIHEKYLLIKHGNKIQDEIRKVTQFIEETNEFIIYTKNVEKTNKKKLNKNSNNEKAITYQNKINKNLFALNKEKKGAQDKLNSLEMKIYKLNIWFEKPYFTYSNTIELKF